MAERTIKLSELLAGLEPEEFSDCPVSALTLDSRAASAGSAFIAVQGSTAHGFSFASNAIELGAQVVLHDGLSAVPLAVEKSVQSVLIPDLRQKLGVIAGRFYSTSTKQPHCVAVTGTNGKTSSVQNIVALLNSRGVKAGSIGTLGWGCSGALIDTGLTTPDVFSVHNALSTMTAQGAVAIAIEASSHALIQGRLDGVAIQTAVFTNLSRDHLDFHGSFENYADAKALLFERSELTNAVLNADDGYCLRMRERVNQAKNCLMYSVEDAGADVYADNIELHAQGLSAKLHTPWGSGTVNLGQVGLFNLQNLLAAIASVCLALESKALQTELNFDQLLLAVHELTTVPGRMQLIDSVNGPTVVVDYAHTPDGLLKALQAVGQHCAAEIWVVFGCGGDRDKGKRAQMAAVAEQEAQHIVITSDNPRSEEPAAILRDIQAGLGAVSTLSVQTIEDRQEAINAAICGAGEQDWVLIAGKGHEDYQLLATGKVPFDDVLVAQSVLQQRNESVQVQRS